MYVSPMHIYNAIVRTILARATARAEPAPETGEVNDKLVPLYETLAKGQVGLIIAGYSYVLDAGKCMQYQTGLHDDALVAD